MAIKKILIVDDSKTAQAYLADILQRHGYEVRTADDAQGALQELARHAPDLVLMDVVMPGQNGFHLTRQISKEPAFSSIPVILCTSKNSETDRVWGMRQGAKDYITKPVDAVQLIAKINQLSGV